MGCPGECVKASSPGQFLGRDSLRALGASVLMGPEGLTTAPPPQGRGLQASFLHRLVHYLPRQPQVVRWELGTDLCRQTLRKWKGQHQTQCGALADRLAHSLVLLLLVDSGRIPHPLPHNATTNYRGDHKLALTEHSFCARPSSKCFPYMNSLKLYGLYQWVLLSCPLHA